MSKRNGINYVQNDEPAFIRQFKQKVGYKEGPDVHTKRQRLEYEEEEDRSDTEEEKPVVVVLKAGDLTADEVSDADKIRKIVEEQVAIREGNFTFKKPVKKGQELEATTEESGSGTAAATVPDKGKHKDKKKKHKETKKSNLLSFGDEEEEEDG